ncbi:E3 ubiquitin-protein ligase WAV3-like [Andrographis paniculata]|uniref:E3 ubiquitin-protein ligase WAV3-like n=1 Tax=Andrographis paniculata TaxID=175694 RepID=UPI0021E82C07|nr:E3 ubiquitin-protein ligase WAV3-like [Andrographis paniculata]XP_051134652.1 E3 ubiquitin-protein ligase WAV3-like [Andrographis paniculata]
MWLSKWIKAKRALRLKLTTCLLPPRTIEDPPAPAPRNVATVSGSDLLAEDVDREVHVPYTPTPSSSGILLPDHSAKPGEKICTICLGTMRPGNGLAIFTAECSHSFHFHCITSNVKHGKQICPVCRANWKEVPFQSPVADKSHPAAQNDILMQRQPFSPRVDTDRQVSSIFQAAPEPAIFDDDDEVSSHQFGVSPGNSTSNTSNDDHSTGPVIVKTYPEVPAVPKSENRREFSIVINLKAPSAPARRPSEIDGPGFPLTSQTSRTPIDLVTVLDVSGSMAGTKLALLKRAMGFVIQNMGPSDRLSVIAFSSSARRLFPLRRMTDSGRHEALQAVNSLRSNGGTNIAEGLRKAAKVMTDRKCKFPIGSIILLSDGQDTRTVNNPNPNLTDYQLLLPVSVCCDNPSGSHIPVYTFGFGADHDAQLMHFISQKSGGTFSFIESETVMQDAFAQCIGGLLSVVVRDLRVEVMCIDRAVRLTSIKSGSYVTRLAESRRKGSIDIGCLYAEEERDFLVTTDFPIADDTCDETALINVKCVYKNASSEAPITLRSAGKVVIERPLDVGPQTESIEVDRQKNRLRCAEAIAEARVAAERGDLERATTIIHCCRMAISETRSAQAGDRMCVSLNAELLQMMSRMSNRQTYEVSGRAYVLSGLSSHSWQRATARGDSTENTSLLQSYKTRSMVDMVNLSQSMVLGGHRPSPTPSSSPGRL